MPSHLTAWVLCLSLSLSPMAAAAMDVGVGFQSGVFRGTHVAQASSVLVFSVKGEAVPPELQSLQLELPQGLGALDEAWALAQLRAKAPQAFNFTWFGPHTLQRATPLQSVDGDALTGAAHDALASALQAISSDYAIQPVEGLQALSLPQGKVSLKAKPVGSGQPRPRMAVQVEVYVDGGLAATMPVWFSVKAMGRIPVFTRDMRAEQEVSADDVEWTTGDMATLASPAIRDTGSLAGLWLRRPVQAGMPVLESDLAHEPTVRRDQRVQVQVVSGGVAIVAWGTAQQSGDTGDLVDVRVDKSEGPCKGRVIGTGVVQIGN